MKVEMSSFADHFTVGPKGKSRTLNQSDKKLMKQSVDKKDSNQWTAHKAMEKLK